MFVFWLKSPALVQCMRNTDKILLGIAFDSCLYISCVSFGFYRLCEINVCELCLLELFILCNFDWSEEWIVILVQKLLQNVYSINLFTGKYYYFLGIFFLFFVFFIHRYPTQIYWWALVSQGVFLMNSKPNSDPKFVLILRK